VSPVPKAKREIRGILVSLVPPVPKATQELPEPPVLLVRLARKGTKVTLVLPVLLEQPVPLAQTEQPVPLAPRVLTGNPPQAAAGCWVS